MVCRPSTWQRSLPGRVPKSPSPRCSMPRESGMEPMAPCDRTAGDQRGEEATQDESPGPGGRDEGRRRRCGALGDRRPRPWDAVKVEEREADRQDRRHEDRDGGDRDDPEGFTTHGGEEAEPEQTDVAKKDE